jgi:hypothetical protein
MTCPGQIKGAAMSDEARENGGMNARPLDDTIAGTGPGIPDDALAPGEELPTPPSDEEVAAIAKKLGAPIPSAADKG